MKILRIPHANSPAAEYVTLSLGAAAMVPMQGQVPTQLIERADKLLYEAKRSGRNQVKS
jgi:two-component system chemotaxis family response regulator WspR